MPFADIDRNRSAYARPFNGHISNLLLRTRVGGFYKQHASEARSASAYIEERKAPNSSLFISVGDDAYRAVSVVSTIKK